MSPSSLLMKLVFENSGDELPIDVINHEVVELFEDSTFLTDKQYNDVAKLTAQLNEHTKNINNFLEFCEINIRFAELNSVSQTDLNSMHYFWAHYYNDEMFTIDDFENLLDFFADGSVVTLSTITNTLDKGKTTDLKVDNDFQRYNKMIHEIEQHFGNNKSFTAKDHMWFDTPSMKYKTSNDIANLNVPPDFVGRTLENKFRYFDNDLQFSDENNWDQTSRKLNINFARPMTIPYSKEYINWCERLKRKPLGRYLNVGNFVNIDENLTTYRTIMYNNTQAGNSFSIRK